MSMRPETFLTCWLMSRSFFPMRNLAFRDEERIFSKFCVMENKNQFFTQVEVCSILQLFGFFLSALLSHKNVLLLGSAHVSGKKLSHSCTFLM